MRTLVIELRKSKRTGIIPLMIAVGIAGAAYAFINFIVRKDTLLNMPLAPMDVLLTQLYGMIMVLNMFGLIVAVCIIRNLKYCFYWHRIWVKYSAKNKYMIVFGKNHIPAITILS